MFTVLLIAVTVFASSQTQDVPLGARVNPAFMAPPTVMTRFSSAHPNVIPAWSANGEHYAAVFKNAQGSASHKEIYDRNGNLLRSIHELPASEQARSIQQFVNAVYHNQNHQLWRMQDSSGQVRVFSTSDNDTLWYGSMREMTAKPSLLNEQEELLLNKLAALEIMDVTTAQLTLVNSADSTLSKVARTRIKEAGKLNRDLTALAVAKNVSLPTELNTRQQQQYQKISGLQGRDYDKAYSKLIGETDHQTKKHLKKLAERATDEDLKNWANKALSSLELNIKARRDAAM